MLVAESRLSKSDDSSYLNDRQREKPTNKPEIGKTERNRA